MHIIRLALSFMLIITVAGATLAARTPLSYLDLRYTNVIEQSNEYTCGAAAVGTLLTYFYGIPTSETDILNVIYESMHARGEEPKQGQGLTAYDLKEALKAKGITSKGFLVKPAALQDYFSRGGLPVIIHLTKPEKHFEVAAGMIEGQIVIADPSWGRSVTPLNLLVKQRGYDGIVLVPIPASEIADQVAVQQQETIQWATLHLGQLSRLRECLP